MNRRTFLQSVILGTLAAPLVTRDRPYRVNDTTIAVDDTQWDSAKGYRVSLWRGDEFIKVVTPMYLGRALIVPVWTRKGEITESSFRLVGRDTSGLAQFRAEYESGPKWWKSRRA